MMCYFLLQRLVERGVVSCDYVESHAGWKALLFATKWERRRLTSRGCGVSRLRTPNKPNRD